MTNPLASEAAHLPDPRARTMWSLLTGLTGAILGSVVGGIAVAADAWPVAVVVLLASTVGGVVFGRTAWRRRTWTLAPRTLQLRRGVVVHRATSIPYDRIQQIDVERGPLERMFRLSQLVVRTAAATTDASLYGLAPEDADSLRQQLLDLAGIDDVV
ncbi:MAG: PH domain-containing protein [Acidimicrobiales bacterium]